MALFKTISKTSRQVKILATIFSVPFWLATPAFSANPEHIQRLLKTNQCAQCDLGNANLEDTNLFGANLINANMKGANLNRANLGEANLTDADLTGAKLNNAYLYQATLENTNLSETDLSNAYLRDAVLTDANFKGANLRGVNLSRTNLTNITLQGVDLSEANLNRVNLSGLSSTGFYGDSIFSGMGYGYPFASGMFYYALCKADPSELSGFSIDSPQLAEMGITFADLSGTNFTGANLSGAVLLGANLNGANLSGANLSGACLTHAKLKNAILDRANLSNARLYGAILENTSLKDVLEADLTGTYRTQAEAELAPRQIEARQLTGSMNRAQQAYYLEYSRFATNIDELGIGIETETEFYRYQLVPQLDPAQSVMTIAQAKVAGLKSYTGIVFIARDEGTDEALTFAQICETNQPSTTPPAMPTLPKNGSGKVQCPAGYHLLD